MDFLKQGKTNWRYVLIVVILAVIVGGGILGWIKRQEVPLVEFPEMKKPGKVADETVNWKIYRNEEYGFEMDYPRDWELRDWELTQDKHHFELKKGICEDERCAIFYTCEFSVSTNKEIPFEIKEPIPGQATAGPHGTWLVLKDKEEVSINDDGLSAIKFYNSEFPGTETYFLKEKNDEGYYFKIVTVVWAAGHDPVVAKEHKCGEIFNQILSTFRFIGEKLEEEILPGVGNYIIISSQKEEDKNVLTFNINFQDYTIKSEKENLISPWREYPDIMGTEVIIPLEFSIPRKFPFIEIEHASIGAACRAAVPLLEIKITVPLNSDLKFELVNKEEEKIKEKVNIQLNCTYEEEYCGPCRKIEDEFYPENPIWYSWERKREKDKDYFILLALFKHNPITRESYILKEAEFKVIVSNLE